ncbi:MAG: hypothetical protein ACJ71K_02810 [Nitrososphaeraceae archaeon]
MKHCQNNKPGAGRKPRKFGSEFSKQETPEAELIQQERQYVQEVKEEFGTYQI